MAGRTSTGLGLAIAYLVAGTVFVFLAVGATVSAFEYVFTNWAMIGLWPLYLLFPEDRLFVLVGAVTGLGVLSVLEHSRLPIAAPRRLLMLSPRRFGEFVATLLVAELVARFTSAAAFLLYLHLFGAYRGDLGTSVGEIVALYQEAVTFLPAFVESAFLFWVGHLIHEIGKVPSGGPNANYALRQIGEIQFFDGVGFAILVGYLVALILSSVGVRIGSKWLLPRFGVLKRLTDTNDTIHSR